MLAVLVALALQSGDGCADAAADADAAFARRDIAAAHALLDTRSDCADEPGFDAMRVQAAWFDVDPAAAGPLAENAFERWSAEGCVRTRDAARLAFIAGASFMAEGEWRRSRYHFWAASRIDSEVGGLSPEAREVADLYSSRIGMYPQDDRLILDSPFLTTLPAAAPECSGLPQLRLSGAASPEDRMLTVLELRSNGAGRVSRVVEIYSYPGPAPEALLDSIRGRRAYDVRTVEQEVYWLDPCADALSGLDPEPLCLPGYADRPETPESETR